MDDPEKAQAAEAARRRALLTQTRYSEPTPFACKPPEADPPLHLRLMGGLRPISQPLQSTPSPSPASPAALTATAKFAVDQFDHFRALLDRFPLTAFNEKVAAVPVDPLPPTESAHASLLPSIGEQKKLRDAIEASPVLAILCRMDSRVRLDATLPNPVKSIIKVPEASSHLFAWKDFESFLNQPMKATEGKDHKLAPESRISRTSDKCERLVSLLYKRIEWFWNLKCRSPLYTDTALQHNPIFIELCCKLIAADKDWQKQADALLDEANKCISEVTKQYSSEFTAFRAHCAKAGIMWPHCRDLLLLCGQCGFEFAPMMIKRDKVACKECKVEISGWRPWHKPWLLHDLSKHDHEFRCRMAVMEQQLAPVSRSLLVLNQQGLSEDFHLLKSSLEKGGSEVDVFDDQKISSDCMLDRLKRMFNAKPPVAHFILYYAGPCASDGRAGFQLGNDVLDMRTIIITWTFSDAGKSGASLSIVADGVDSANIADSCSQMLQDAGVNIILAVQTSGASSGGHQKIPLEHRFAAQWLELVTNKRSPQSVLSTLLAYSYVPVSFSTYNGSVKKTSPTVGFPTAATAASK
jgi:hypothetical protein